MADYTSIDYKMSSNSLGNYSTFQPLTQKKIDVVFQPDLSNGYYSVLSMNNNGGDDIGYHLSNDESTDSSNEDNDISGNKEEQSEKPIYSFGSNPVNGIFIGSVTVLGLFLLYRLLKK